MLIFRGSFVFFSFFFGFRRRRRRRQPPTLLFCFVFFVSPFGISLGKRRVGFRFLFSAPLVRPLPSELGKKFKKNSVTSSLGRLVNLIPCRPLVLPSFTEFSLLNRFKSRLGTDGNLKLGKKTR